MQGANRWLVVLLCINAALLTALVACRVDPPEAQAQVRAFDFVLIPGKLQEELEMLWIVDMATYDVTTATYDENRKRIVFGEILPLGEQLRLPDELGL